MIPVNEYVDMEHPRFEKMYEEQGNLGLWNMLDSSTRDMLVVEYLADRISDAIEKISRKEAKSKSTS